MHTPEKIIIGQYRWDKLSKYLYPNTDGGDDSANNGKSLTNKQQALLQCLYDAAPNTLTREELTLSIWQSEHISQESLPQLINRTRRTLEDNDKSIIINTPGIGYSLNCITEHPQADLTQADSIQVIENTDDAQPINVVRSTAQKPRLFLEKKKIRFAIVALIIGLSVFNAWNLCSAYLDKQAFIKTRFATPCTNIEKTNDSNKLKVTIDNIECIYEKNNEIIYCL
ncbi:winged helix-turn-helix domain-containing protein [Vibrio renipiscarius]|uniref:OmpR/PhoB-type domain-containing protein n=2 Tax=Vibrio renipiscarius TaxID=1461322 RepID=A0A0C2KHR7_9VIBR|nr:winged helix-turn-helix domain-containing protein [Vibrio renipiscarius]KII75647.1 hypothetical protein PL18_18190 [Vibrio renipiscarius]KII81903.1 hypothetical protein OJ16_01545 [Vibrio renipiscarius]